MRDIKLLLGGVFLVLAVAAIAGCAGTAPPSATPATGSNLLANNNLPGSPAPGGTIPGGMPNGTMPGNTSPSDTSNSTILMAVADSQGNASSNGGVITFLADHETLTRDLTADNISMISATLQNGTILTGAINAANTAKPIALSIDSTSKWVVTGDSYLSTLAIEGNTLSRIVGNGHTVYYDASLSANSWLGGKTYPLANGGYLTPEA